MTKKVSKTKAAKSGDKSEGEFMMAAYFTDAAIAVFGDTDKAKQFLNSPDVEGSSTTRLKAALEDPNSSRLEDQLLRIEHGIHI